MVLFSQGFIFCQSRTACVLCETRRSLFFQESKASSPSQTVTATPGDSGFRCEVCNRQNWNSCILLLSMLVPFPVVTDGRHSSYIKSTEIRPNLSVGENKCYLIFVLLHFRKKTKEGGGRGREKRRQKNSSEYYPSSLKP